MCHPAENIVRVAVKEERLHRRDIGSLEGGSYHEGSLASLGARDQQVAVGESQLDKLTGAVVRVILKLLDRRDQRNIASCHECHNPVEQAVVFVRRAPQNLTGNGEPAGSAASAEENPSAGIQRAPDRLRHMTDVIEMHTQHLQRLRIDRMKHTQPLCDIGLRELGEIAG